MKAFVHLVTLLSLVACGNRIPDTQMEIQPDSENPQIFGGQPVSNSLQFSIVGIYSAKGNGGALCSGTLISERVVLTAAHCLTEDPSKLQIFFGSDLNVKPRTIRQVEKVVLHPDYDPQKKTDQNDIGLVWISGPLPPAYKPTALLKKPAAFQSPTSTRVFGFGISSVFPGSNEPNRGAGILREISLSFEDKNFSSTEASLLQGPAVGGMCSGDSGGPATIDIDGKAVVWGVGSRATGAFFVSCVLNSIYTRVDIYESWIQEMLQD